MSCIKITPADQAFSKCVRQAANWTCERCGKYHPPSETYSAQGLECSHFHGRANWSIRFHPDNAAALCSGCHMFFGGHPHDHQFWFEERIGDFKYQVLLDLRRDTGLGKVYRKTKGKGEIAKHYRDELVRMVKTGERTFEAWQ